MDYDGMNKGENLARYRRRVMGLDGDFSRDDLIGLGRGLGLTESQCDGVLADLKAQSIVVYSHTSADGVPYYRSKFSR